MAEGVLALFLGIVALIPVLLIGATMMELLIREAPRRGKRPDDLTNQSSRLFVRVVTTGGWVLSGTPREVVQRLSARERAPLPFFLTERRAENALRHWESSGRLMAQFEWRA